MDRQRRGKAESTATICSTAGMDGQAEGKWGSVGGRLKNSRHNKTGEKLKERTLSGVLWRCAGTDFGRRVDGGALDSTVAVSIMLLSFNVIV